MRPQHMLTILTTVATALLVTSCANTNGTMTLAPMHYNPADYEARMPAYYPTGGEKTVVVDPNVHAWGAYSSDGHLVRGGIATAGGNWCDDISRPCRTAVGKFRIYSEGDGGCYSKSYPKPHGHGLMPYCMYFSNGMALHGSPDGAVVEDNISHGCVRMRISDAEWMRYNFANIGTRVVVKQY